VAKHILIFLIKARKREIDMRKNLYRDLRAKKGEDFYICWIGNFTSDSVSRFRHATDINHHLDIIKQFFSSSYRNSFV